MKLYICSIEELADAASYDAASLKIDSHRKEKMSCIKSEQDRRRSLCAGLLLNYAVAQFRQETACADKPAIRELSVKELLRVEKQEYDYRQEENGKPYISDKPDFHFSLSHSGDYVLCAWDLDEIGADLQCMDREVKDTLAKKVMTAEEYRMYTAMPQQKQKTEFYRIWTIKESYCKLTGKGLSQDFRDIATDKISYQADLWKENYWLAVSRYE